MIKTDRDARICDMVRWPVRLALQQAELLLAWKDAGNGNARDRRLGPKVQHTSCPESLKEALMEDAQARWSS